MLQKIGALGRHMVGNRRLHQRQRVKYDTILRDHLGREVFRGRTTNLSPGGAKVAGFPRRQGTKDGQEVSVEFCLLPRDRSKPGRRAVVRGRVCRVEEKEDGLLVAVTFEQPPSS
ncbi:MAG: PilZ domain-containing protein [Planctomycetota bacterium]|nr:PilZ domain-containing protein [Planctomycetota bacterium]